MRTTEENLNEVQSLLNPCQQVILAEDVGRANELALEIYTILELWENESNGN